MRGSCRGWLMLLALLASCGGADGGGMADAAAGDTPSQRSITTAVGSGAVLPVSQPLSLQQASPQARSLLEAVGAAPGCRVAYRAAVAGGVAQAAVFDPQNAVFFDAAQLRTWRARVGEGAAMRRKALPVGAPDDWLRIETNAARFRREGEAVPAALDDGQARATHGSLARDAAYHAVIMDDAGSRAAVGRYLIEQAASDHNDFGRLCFVTEAGRTLDGWYWHASWLLRYVVTYDAVRASLPESERVVIEHFIRRNASMMAAHLDWGLAQVFPARLAGDYQQRAADATETRGVDAWWRKSYDENGDCTVDADEQTRRWEVPAYVRRDGSLGPRLSTLSQWFNNRRSAAAVAVAAAGAVLNDAVMLDRAGRYVMEWLTYAVWSDGSEGEYARHGDYCVAQQGVIYAQTNLQAAWMTARLWARRGDERLLHWQTCDGLWGSACGVGERPKSLMAQVQTLMDLRTGVLDRYAPEPWRQQQLPREATHLGAVESHYRRGERITDNYHELALLYWADGAAQTAGVPLRAWVMREGPFASRPFPGTAGHAVATGFGSWVGAWTDVFNAMPAVLLFRP